MPGADQHGPIAGTVVLATTDDAFDTRVRLALGEHRGCTIVRHDTALVRSQVAIAVTRLTAGAPSVVVLGPDVQVATALELARQLDAWHPEVVVVVAADLAPEHWQEVLRSGVRDVVAPTAGPVELREAIERAVGTAQRRRAAMVDAAPAVGGRGGRVVVVTSPKGGSGKTFLATNLAVTLARRLPDSTVLVDLDVTFGDVAAALRLLPEHTIADALGAPELDGPVIKACLTKHPSGLYVLCAPENPAAADVVSPDRIPDVIRTLADEFAYVVCDTGAGVDEHSLAAMEQATDLVLLASTDVPSVRATRKEVDALDLLGLTSATRHFVLNRADARVGLALGDIEMTVGMRVGVQVPSSRSVPVALNQGEPVVDAEPRSAVARAVNELAGTLLGDLAQETERRRHALSLRARVDDLPRGGIP
jgi:pilus assembly protein CpaE